jgi:hypothetical protein
MGELMDKIIGSEENWEDGRLGLDEEHQVVVDETIDLQVDTSLGLVEIKFKIDVSLDEKLETFAKENGLIKKAAIRKILEDFFENT